MRAILMLHSVDETGSVISMTEGQLRSLVQSVRDSGHEIVALSTLLESPAPRQVALTFDDGMASVASAAAPVLEELGAPATLFLTTGYVGRDNGWPSQAPDAPRLPMMTWDDIESLQARGWQIEAHSRTHPDLRTLDEATLETELAEPCEEIERRLGKRPSHFAYPYGYLDERVVAAARKYYRSAVTTSMGALRAGTTGAADAMRIPRLDTFYLRDRRWHRRFGGRRFRAYVRARAALRRLRKHPGETG